MDAGEDAAEKEHFEGPDAPLSFVVPEEQVESLKRPGKGGLGKIGVPGSIRTYRKRVESTSQWASKAARKTAALPQKNINNAKKSIAKRLKPDVEEQAASPALSPVSTRKKHLKPSGGSMPSAQVRSMLSLSMDAEESRQSPKPSKLSVECVASRDGSPTHERHPTSIVLSGSMGSRTASFDDLALQESKESAGERALSPIQSHTYLLDSDDQSDRTASPQKRAFLRSSSDSRPRRKMAPATRSDSGGFQDSQGTGDENSDFEHAEDDRSLDGDEYGDEENIFEADEDDDEVGSPEYDSPFLEVEEELLGDGVSIEPDRERKNFNKLIFSIPKGATKKSKKAGNYLLNVPKGVKSSVATGMDRASGVAGIPGKKVSRMVKAHNDTSGGGSPDAAGVTVAQAPVSSEELMQFLQAGTQDGKFVKAVPPGPEVAGSHKKKSLVRSVRGSKSTESGMDKKQLRQEVAGIKKSIDQFNRAVMSSLDATRTNADQLQKFGFVVDRTFGTTETIRNEGQQERLALHQELSEVSKKLDTVIKAVHAQQHHLALVEGRLMTVQRYQATQVTLLGIVYMVINWLVLGMSIVQTKLVMGYRKATGTIPIAPAPMPAIEDLPAVQDVTNDEEEEEPQGRKRSNAIKLEEGVKFGRLQRDEDEDNGDHEIPLPETNESQPSNYSEDERNDRLMMLGSQGIKKQEWPEDAPPPSVASVAAAHAAGIQAEHQRLLRQRAEGGRAQGSTKRLRPSFANSKYA